METEHCDVVVIGCGPAGSTAAKEVADEGYDVLIIEKKQTIGEPVQCAEYVPKLITQHIKVERNSVTNKVRSMRTYLPNGEIVETNAPGFIVNRAVFDKNLAANAVESGAKLLIGTKAVKFNKKSLIARKGYTDIKINAKIIIGADGPRSIVGTWINQKNSDFIVAKQYEMILTERMEHTEAYFDDTYYGGYAWLFPKGKYANIGIGISLDHSVVLSKLLEVFVKRQTDQKKILPNSIVRKTAGLIPINGPMNKTALDNIVLAGDAAGFTHPITGAGILNAIISGGVAGKIVRKALEFKDIEILKTYELEWKKILGRNLETALNRRKLYDNYFHEKTDEFQDLNEALQKCWVGFRGYYHED